MMLRIACSIAVLAFSMGRTPPEPAPVEKSSAPAPAEEAAVSEWKGQFCAVATPSAELIQDAEAWKTLWKETFAKEPPQADFSRYVAAAVFLGSRNTGGYHVEFLEPETRGAATVLRWREKRPRPGSMVIQAFTQPYAIRLFPRPSGPLRLEKVSK